MRVDEVWPDVPFSPTEEALLAYLLAAPDRTATAAELLEQVWGYASGARTRTVTTTVYRIRKKIEPVPDRPAHLLFVRGQGYTLRPPGPPVLDRAAVTRRLEDWLGREQEWVTLVAATPGRRGNLTGVAPSPLFGRGAAQDALLARLREGERLITLHGAAGLGKTTLALAVSATLQSAYPGGVWFCAAETVRDEEDLLEAIGSTLGIVRAPDARRPLGDAIAHALRHLGEGLLVLDNLEQVDRGAIDRIGSLLASAPQLQVLTTSRRVLGLPGEGLAPVQPLPPADAHAMLAARLERVGVDAPHDADLDRILEPLEGVPLAIEMAAARARLLPLDELGARLHHGRGLLDLGQSQAIPRQRTLRETIAWSWTLLTPTEQAALAALGAFRKGFSIAAAEEVIGGATALEDLAALVDQALVHRGPESRLALFESVRQFVEAEVGVPAEARARHAAWAVSHARTHRHLDGTHAEAMVRELANLIAAHAWLHLQSDPRALDLLDAMSPLYVTRGLPRRFLEMARATRSVVATLPALAPRLHAVFGRALLAARNPTVAQVEIDRGLARVAPDSHTHARLLVLKALSAHARLDGEAGLAHATAALEAARAHDDPRLVFQAGQLRAASLIHLDRLEAAESEHRRGLAEAGSLGAIGLRAQASLNLADCVRRCGPARYDEVEALLEQAMGDAREAGNGGIAWSVLNNLAILHVMRRRYHQADAVFAEILEGYPTFGGRGPIGGTHINAGLTALYVDDPPRAVRYFRTALQELRDAESKGVLPLAARAHLGVALAESGEDDEADALLEGLPATVQAGSAWPGLHAQLRLCCAHRHLIAWRRQGEPSRLDAARAVLAEHGSTSPDAAATAVLRRALARVEPMGDAPGL